jgi:hypothetical protein
LRYYLASSSETSTLGLDKQNDEFVFVVMVKMATSLTSMEGPFLLRYTRIGFRPITTAKNPVCGGR